jgi:hypothetical protein
MERLLKCLFGFALTVSICAAMVPEGDQIEPTISFQGHQIRFANREKPFYSGASPMVPIRTVCLAIGAGVKSSRDGRQWTITRGADRIDCTIGTPSFTFNGVKQNLRAAPESRDHLLYVPIEMVQAISGGGLDVHAVYGSDRETSIFYLDRLLHFKSDEAPFRQGSTVFVHLRTTAACLGAKITTSRDGDRFTILRTRDKVVYELGSRWFLFNDAERMMKSESITRGKNVFVPIELFQAFVGEELNSR